MMFLNLMLVVACAGIAMLVIPLGLTVLRLRRLRWKDVSSQPVVRDDMDMHVRSVLDLASDGLQHLGYHYIESMQSEMALDLPDGKPTYFDLYQHSGGHSFALVSKSSTPTAQSPFTVQWLTCFQDGTNVATLNGTLHLSPFVDPGWKVYDPYLPSWKESLGFHLARIAETHTAICTDPAQVMQRIHSSFTAMVPGMLRGGLVHPAAEQGRYQMAWGTAVRFAIQILRGQWRVARRKTPSALSATAVQNDSPAISDASQSAMVLADIQAYRTQVAMAQPSDTDKASGRRRSWVSAALFLAIGMVWWSWETAAALLVVIAIHEGGHYAAMRLTGYRNVSVFFIPGLGGLATGEKPGASPFEKLLVYLAGPMPGIVLAIGIYGVLKGTEIHPLMTQWLWMSLIVNYLNLLPITPLDGGRVVDTFLFARVPRLRFAFAVACCAALATAGIAWDDTVLKVVAVIVAVGLTHQWRVMQVSRAVAHDGKALSEDDALQKIFTALHQPKFHTWQFPRRIGVVRSLLPDLLSQRPSLGQCIGGLCLYLVCLVGPLFAIGIAYPQILGVAGAVTTQRNFVPDDVDLEPPAPISPPPKDWTQALSQISSLPPDKRLEVHLGAGHAALDSEDDATALTQYAAAWAIAKDLPQRDLRRIATMEGLATVTEDAAQQTDYRKAIVQELANPVGPEIPFVARALEQLSYGDIGTGERVDLLRQAVQLRENDGTEAHDLQSLAYTQLLLAQALEANGQFPETEATLRKRIDAIALPPATDKSRHALSLRVQRALNQSDIAWFLITHGRAWEALPVLESALAGIPHPTTVSWIYPQHQILEALIWGDMQIGDRKKLAIHWALYEKSSNSGTYGDGRKNLALQLDKALAAAALGDAEMGGDARKTIATILDNRPPPAAYCSTQAGPQQSNWRHSQFQARANLLKTLGKCN